MTAAEIIKKKFTKEKLHRFIFGTREKQGVGKQLVVYALLICIGFVYLYPVLYMISTSFMSRNDLLDTSVKWLPSKLYLQNFIDATKAMDYVSSFEKGILIAGLPTLCNVVICMMVGYGFARYEFKGKKILMGILIFSYILPRQITMIPTYVLYTKMGIQGTLWAFILPALFGNGFFRGSDDPRNAALNYGYAVMRAGIARNLVVHGLEPCIGLHHRSELNNFNLADDLIEPFRPVVDLYVTQNFSKGDDVLTPRQKAGLFNLTNYLVKQAGRRYRVMLSIDRVCTALANSVTAGENLLELPELIPLELHQYE